MAQLMWLCFCKGLTPLPSKVSVKSQLLSWISKHEKCHLCVCCNELANCFLHHLTAATKRPSLDFVPLPRSSSEQLRSSKASSQPLSVRRKRHFNCGSVTSSWAKQPQSLGCSGVTSTALLAGSLIGLPAPTKSGWFIRASWRSCCLCLHKLGMFDCKPAMGVWSKIHPLISDQQSLKVKELSAWLFSLPLSQSNSLYFSLICSKMSNLSLK